MKIKPWLKSHKDYFPVGRGWRKLVTKLCKDIIAIDDKVNVLQVKEKFGGLRFYIDKGNMKVHSLIVKAEEKSFKICEKCGTECNVTTSGEWAKTLCNNCKFVKIKKGG